MPINDALADIGAALNGAAQQPAGVPAAAAPQTGVDAALADLSMSPDQLRAATTAPAPAKPGGFFRNIGAGLNSVLAEGVGAPVDVGASVLNQLGDVQRGLNAALPPRLRQYAGDVPPPITNPFGGSDTVRSGLGLVGANPNDVGVNDTADIIGRSLGTGAAGMVAPYMAGRAMIAQGIDSGMPGAVARMLGGSAPADAGALRTAAGAAGNAALGGASALGGQGAEALLPENSPYRPLANVAGQLVVGGGLAAGAAATRAGVNAASDATRNLIAPMRGVTYEGGVPRSPSLDAGWQPSRGCLVGPGGARCEPRRGPSRSRAGLDADHVSALRRSGHRSATSRAADRTFRGARR